MAYDHVVGADPTVHTGWNGPYAVDSTFHEPFVLFGYLAAITELELVTGIIILPQRQTALVAKQAAQVDILSQGRLRLGVGLGWNQVEYEALGMQFHDRGRRIDEQVELLRLLWTQRTVNFHGDLRERDGCRPRAAAGATPDPDLVRGTVAARLPPGGPPRRRLVPRDATRTSAHEARRIIEDAAVAAGREPGSLAPGHPALRWSRRHRRRRRRLAATSATHLSIDTMRLVPDGPVGVDRHLAALAELADAIGLPRRSVT